MSFLAVLEYLRQEKNVKQRAGAITLGAVLGFLLGLRKRLIKKILYPVTGGLAMAAACYPDEAREYTQMSVSAAKEMWQAFYEIYQGGKLFIFSSFFR